MALTWALVLTMVDHSTSRLNAEVRNSEVSAGSPLVCDVSQNTRKKKTFFFEFWAATAIFLHEQALFCLHAWASVWECGLGLGSGSRQHMPDTALWGPAFIPSCFHSPTFGRCAEKVFSQVFTFQEKKCEHLLLHTPGYKASHPDTWHVSASQQLQHFGCCTFSGFRTSKQTTGEALSTTCLKHLSVKWTFRAAEKQTYFHHLCLRCKLQQEILHYVSIV